VHSESPMLEELKILESNNKSPDDSVTVTGELLKDWAADEFASLFDYFGNLMCLTYAKRLKICQKAGFDEKLQNFETLCKKCPDYGRPSFRHFQSFVEGVRKHVTGMSESIRELYWDTLDKWNPVSTGNVIIRKSDENMVYYITISDEEEWFQCCFSKEKEYVELEIRHKGVDKCVEFAWRIPYLFIPTVVQDYILAVMWRYKVEPILAPISLRDDIVCSKHVRVMIEIARDFFKS